MYIRSLELANFRNYVRLDFQPSRNLNILTGRNGQGKSAILESIYLLATSKSHRTSRDTDMIACSETSARAKADVARSAENDVGLEIVLSREANKQIKINSVRHPRIADLIGQVKAVMFSTEDIDIIKGEPSHRRRFLNLEISQTSPRYVYALGRCKRVLEQRNNLLREIKMGAGRAEGLDVWDEQFAEYAAGVMVGRAEFVEFLGKTAAEIYSRLTGGAEEIAISYKPSVDMQGASTGPEVVEKFAAVLSLSRQADFARGTSTHGPHRDDLKIEIGGMPAREFASQGQQRTAAIAIKLAEIDIMCESAGEAPVVLLDDIMAELDESRRAKVLGLTVGRCQTLVATTHISELDQSALNAAENFEVFEVKSGTVTRT